jgi:adenylate kinase
MLNVVIFGAPGSGKGTQSEWIAREFGLDHISTGEALRSEIKNKTRLGLQAKGYINRGYLLPDRLIITMLAQLLIDKGGSKGIIFDGFPRTLPQAAALKEMLSLRHTHVAAVLNLEVDTDELVARLLNRGQQLGRSDDNLETIRARMDVYHTQTAPLLDLYGREGILHTIRGVGSIESIFKQISAILSSCQTS